MWQKKKKIEPLLPYKRVRRWETLGQRRCKRLSESFRYSKLKRNRTYSERVHINRRRDVSVAIKTLREFTSEKRKREIAANDRVIRSEKSNVAGYSIIIIQ